MCLIYVEPQDGQASYGRSLRPIDSKCLPRNVAIHQVVKDWDKYHHFGKVPRMKECSYIHTKGEENPNIICKWEQKILVYSRRGHRLL